MSNNNHNPNETPIYDKVMSGNVPTVEKNVPSAVPQPKVYAATVGAGVGSALATIAVWWVEFVYQIDIPNEVALSIGVVVTGGLAFIGGYFKKN